MSAVGKDVIRLICSLRSMVSPLNINLRRARTTTQLQLKSFLLLRYTLRLRIHLFASASHAAEAVSGIGSFTAVPITIDPY